MASLPHQISYASGAYTSTNKNIITRPCIAQLHKKMHFGNLVANPQLPKPTLLSPIAFVAPMRDLREHCQNEKWKAWCSHDGSSGVAPHEFPSPRSQLVLDFYEAVNEKNIQKLEQLLSPRHCAYHDLLFYGPYEGKQTVLNFLRSAMDALGPNVHIDVENLEETDHFLVTVFWHLEWNAKKIPFTNGCRIFMFEEVEGRLYISQITGLEELPVKPGELVLKILKTVRTFFDSYPLAAGAILESHASEDGTHGGPDHFDLFGPKHRS